jgi:hypothetical protein
MKLREAIDRIDGLKHNTFTQGEKVMWINQLDGRVKAEIIDTHEGGDDIPFSPYNEKNDLGADLLIPEPFDSVYIRWLEAQVDYYNGELGRYNNSIAMFNEEYSAFQRHYNRHHMPKGRGFKFF